VNKPDKPDKLTNGEGLSDFVKGENGINGLIEITKENAGGIIRLQCDDLREALETYMAGATDKAPWETQGE
jgi:hypothetical protein